MNSILTGFNEHSREIGDYLDFLSILENEMQNGIPKIGSKVITPQQVYALYSSAFVQIYNLVEGTISKCIKAICDVIIVNGDCTLADLSEAMRKEWLRYAAKTHYTLAPDKRLEKLEDVLRMAVDGTPVSEFRLEKGGGGNWSDSTIEKFLYRIGCDYSIDEQLKKRVKRPFKDDAGVMQYLMKLRNDLSHGNVSFCQCGQDVSFTDIKNTYAVVHEYLNVIVSSVSQYIENRHYLRHNVESATA